MNSYIKIPYFGTGEAIIDKYLFKNISSIRKHVSTRGLRNKPDTKVPETKAATSSTLVKTEGPIFLAAHAGSGFCRAALVCNKGRILNIASMPCRIYQSGVFKEMSTENIWTNLIKCIKKMTESVEQGEIKGIGFTAISALVCLDEKGNPVTTSISRDPTINVILRYDNRTLLETQKINKGRHTFMQYFGERVLPDLQESRLMWLKGNLKSDCWEKAGHFFELSDFLTWKATGSLIRSSSTLGAQWTYKITVSGRGGWDHEFFKEVGMPELTEDNFKKIGSEVQPPGIALPGGLLENVAKETGLKAALPVSTGMNDGLVGCLGLTGCNIKVEPQDVTNRLCIVFGTKSAEHFILSREPHFVKGVKGPFRDSVLPHMWLNFAGQTTAESVLNYIIDTHPATPEIQKHIGQKMHIHKYLNKIIKIKAHQYKEKSRSFLTRHLHVLPDFDGNISPFGDPWIRGMISGLSITSNQESLALLYLATMQSLAYSTRHIISVLREHGHDIRCILIGGYIGKNSLFVNLHKDVCQLPTISPAEPRSKLIGAAILAGVASNYFRDFDHATQEMCGAGLVEQPENDPDIIEYHEKKYQVFLKMYSHQSEYRRIMSGGHREKKVDANN